MVAWNDAVDYGSKWDSYCGSLVKWFDKNQKQMGVSKGLESCKVKFCNLMIEDAKPYAIIDKKASEYGVIYNLTGKSQTPKSVAKFKKDNPAIFKKAMAKNLADQKKYYAKNKSLVSTIKKKYGFNAYKNSAWSKWYKFNNADAQFLYHSGGKSLKKGGVSSTDLWSLMKTLHNIRDSNKMGAKDKKVLSHWKIKTTFKPIKEKTPVKKKTVKKVAKRKTTTKKKTIYRGKRKSPSTSATSVRVGTKMRGGDGKMYVCKTYSRAGKRVKRWVRA